MSQRDPARFDLQAALSRSLQPVDLRELQKKNVNRVRLLKTAELNGSVRDAIDRALTGHMEELRKLREREEALAAEVAALHAKVQEESSRRQIAESALSAARSAGEHPPLCPPSAPPTIVEVRQGPSPEEIAKIREEAKGALEELADLRIALEAAQEDAAEGRAELLRVQEQFDHMRSELERNQIELEEARGRLGEALVERERMRIELDSEMTRELEVPPLGGDTPATSPGRAPEPIPGDRTAVAALASLGLVASPESVPETVLEVPEPPPAHGLPGSAQSSETEVLPAAPARPRTPKVAFFGFGPALSTGGGRPATWRRREGASGEDEARR